MRRVVITGIGLVSPLAASREATWERLLAGESGAGPIDSFDSANVPCKIACQVPYTSGRGGGSAEDPHAFDPDAVLSAKERRRIDEFILYAIAASDEAVADAGWHPETEEDQERTGGLIPARCHVEPRGAKELSHDRQWAGHHCRQALATAKCTSSMESMGAEPTLGAPWGAASCRRRSRANCCPVEGTASDR